MMKILKLTVTALTLVGGLTVGANANEPTGTLYAPGQLCVPIDTLNEVLAKNNEEEMFRKELQQGWNLVYYEDANDGSWTFTAQNSEGACVIGASLVEGEGT